MLYIIKQGFYEKASEGDGNCRLKIRGKHLQKLLRDSITAIEKGFAPGISSLTGTGCLNIVKGLNSMRFIKSPNLPGSSNHGGNHSL